MKQIVFHAQSAIICFQLLAREIAMTKPLEVAEVVLGSPDLRSVKLWPEPDYSWQAAYDALMAVPEKHRTSARAVCMSVYYTRPETPEELKFRQKLEREKADQERRKERDTLSALLAKYPDAVA